MSTSPVPPPPAEAPRAQLSDVPDYVYMPFSLRRSRRFRRFGYPMVAIFLIGICVMVAGRPLPERLISLVPPLWVAAGVVIIDRRAAWQRRRRRRAYLEGTILPATVRRKWGLFGEYRLELSYSFGRATLKAKAWAPGELYSACQPGDHIRVHVHPSDPFLCIPVCERVPATPRCEREIPVSQGEGQAAPAPVEESLTAKPSLRAKIARWIGFVLLIYGGVLWCGGPLANWARPAWLSNATELPLGSLRAVAVDGAGRIYCGSMYYGRVQVYSPHGRFLRGWFVDADWGSFRLRVTPGGVLDVATARSGRLCRYEATGRLLGQPSSAPGLFKALGEQGERECRDAAGNLYTIHDPALCPRVVRTDRRGNAVTIVRTPLGRWLLMAPFPAYLFCVAGVLLLVLTDRRFLRQLSALVRRGHTST